MDLMETLGLGGKVAEENIIFYALYPDSNSGSSATALPALLSCCNQILETYLKGYIWQKDVLQLTLSTLQLPPWMRTRKRASGKNPSSSEGVIQDKHPAFLWGEVRFGDNVDDEWFIVYLLLQLSRSMSEISIQVWDNDGDFLLIEAAYALPRWLKPEVSANRVWLRQGQIHIIPQPSAKQPTLPPFPTLSQALSIITSGTVETANSRVQAPINERLAEFPGKARASMHRARVLLPAALARVLESDQQLVSAAVEAFSSRDAEGMKAASRMTHFPMSHDTAPVLVTFSRCLYAQLAQQRFSAPKGLSLPPTGHPLHKAGDLGLKVTAGFEILAFIGARDSETASSTSKMATGEEAESATQPHKDDPAWLSFLSALNGLGYFQANIPGSAAHRTLTATAMADFASARRRHDTIAGSDKPRSPWEQIQHILAQPQQETSPATAAAAEDDDSWMESQGMSLDAEIARREEEVKQHASSRSMKGEKGWSRSQGTTAASSAGVTSTAGRDSGFSDSEAESEEEGGAVQERVQEVDADALAPQLRGFVEYLKSGMEGAEAPQDKGSCKSRTGSNKSSLTAPTKPPSHTRNCDALRQPCAATNRHQNSDCADRAVQSAGREIDVDLDPMSFFSELGRVLGMDLGSSLDFGFEGLEGLGSSWATAEQQENASSQQPHQRTDIVTASSRPTPTHLLDSNNQTERESGDDDETSSEGSSFFSSRGSEDGSSDEDSDLAAATSGASVSTIKGSKLQHSRQVGGRAGRVSRRDVDTETDSDDEESDNSDEDGSETCSSEGEGVEGVHTSLDRDHSRRAGRGSSKEEVFSRAYDAALALELVGTKMAETFERLPMPGAVSADEPGGLTSSGDAQNAVDTSSNQGLQRILQPVDLDLNLVKNLIRSYTSQQGLSGPASNLAGLLGLELPRGDIVD